MKKGIQKVEKELKKHQESLELAKNAQDKVQIKSERKAMLELEKKKVKKEDMLLNLQEKVEDLEKQNSQMMAEQEQQQKAEAEEKAKSEAAEKAKAE